MAESECKDSLPSSYEKYRSICAIGQFLKRLRDSGLDEFKPRRRRLAGRSNVEAAGKAEAASYLIAVKPTGIVKGCINARDFGLKEADMESLKRNVIALCHPLPYRQARRCALGVGRSARTSSRPEGL